MAGRGDGGGGAGQDDPSAAWVKIRTQSHGRTYFHNPLTEEVVWKLPRGAKLSAQPTVTSVEQGVARGYKRSSLMSPPTAESDGATDNGGGGAGKDAAGNGAGKTPAKSKPASKTQPKPTGGGEKAAAAAAETTRGHVQQPSKSSSAGRRHRHQQQNTSGDGQRIASGNHFSYDNPHATQHNAGGKKPSLSSPVSRVPRNGSTLSQTDVDQRKSKSCLASVRGVPRSTWALCMFPALVLIGMWMYLRMAQEKWGDFRPTTPDGNKVKMLRLGVDQRCEDVYTQNGIEFRQSLYQKGINDGGTTCERDFEEQMGNRTFDLCDAYCDRCRLGGDTAKYPQVPYVAVVAWLLVFLFLWLFLPWIRKTVSACAYMNMDDGVTTNGVQMRVVGVCVGDAYPPPPSPTLHTTHLYACAVLQACCES